MGAAPATVEVRVEVDTRQKRLAATARGTPELRTAVPSAALPSSEQLRAIAAAACGVAPAAMRQAGCAGTLTAFQGEAETRRVFGLVRRRRRPVRVVDHEGVVRLAIPDGVVVEGALASLGGQLQALVDDMTAFGDAGGLIPDVFLLVAGKVVDLSGLATRDHVLSLVRAEHDALGGDEAAVAILAPKTP